MLVRVLKRFEGPAGRVFLPGEVLTLEGRNVPGLIEFGFLSAEAEPVAETAAPADTPSGTKRKRRAVAESLR